MESLRELDRISGPRGRKIEVGGVGLYVLEEGQGKVPVVFVSGMGDDLRTWDYVHHSVREFARAVSYSRAGLGFSDEGPVGRTLPAQVRELHDLMGALGVNEPAVLVGHGLGAVIVRVFAAQHPGKVAGLVLIEPTHEEEGIRYRALDPDSWDRYVARQARLYAIDTGALGAEYALLRSLLEQGELPVEGSVQDVPTVVMTSLRVPETVRWVGDTQGGMEVKVDLHRKLIKGLTWSRHVRTRRSGGLFHREMPALVIEAIREVMDAAAGTSGLN